MIKQHKKTSIFLTLLAVLLLPGCSSVSVQDYADNQPRFDLYEFFSGSIRGWGIVQSRNGALLRQFVVDIDGRLSPSGELILDEHFDWSDGEKSRRIWSITRKSAHEFSGRTDDVIATATGSAAGNALNWSYTLNLVVDDQTWKIDFDDWMFLQPDNVLINRATMKKFGFRVGEITIAFMKR